MRSKISIGLLLFYGFICKPTYASTVTLPQPTGNWDHMTFPYMPGLLDEGKIGDTQVLAHANCKVSRWIHD